MGRLILISCQLALAACTQQMRAKEWGGKTSEDLPPGQKLVTVTWEQQNLWYLLRPMKSGEKPGTYDLHESSSWGVFQGDILIHETPAAPAN